jgi:2-polyprenyl-6-methoxyphenol hydroxylase-like FAD-dependent oxidoreductase
MKREKAIVIGGSIAGLLSARVLSEYFTSVVIVERDYLPLQPEKRQGVPQSVQPHVLFARGYRILSELFPGIGSQLTAANALAIDWVQEFHFFSKGNWSLNPNTPSEVTSFTCSRPLLEWAIRKRLRELPNIEFVEECRVLGLVGNSSKAQITGVKLQTAGCDVEELFADLVVDASGRGSNAPLWLENLGFAKPQDTVINPFLGYATRRYKQPENFTSDWKVMLVSQQAPNNKRLGYLAKIENGEWIATLGGYGCDFPPLDDKGFLEFASSLASPQFYEAIKDAEPVSPIYAHRATANRLRHYEKIKMPQGFVALGDAVCALCPVYGQGMTVSALSAMVLKNWLHDDSKSITSRFQKRLAKSNALHWMMATQQDSQFPTTSGVEREGDKKKPNFVESLFAWYNQKAMSTMHYDPSLHTLFMEIAHLLKSPLALYHPQVIFRVLQKKT